MLPWPWTVVAYTLHIIMVQYGKHLRFKILSTHTVRPLLVTTYINQPPALRRQCFVVPNVQLIVHWPALSSHLPTNRQPDKCWTIYPLAIQSGGHKIYFSCLLLLVLYITYIWLRQLETTSSYYNTC